MSHLLRIQQLFENADHMTRLLNIRMEEETGRLDGIPGVLPRECLFFNAVEDNQAIRKAYEIMQNRYVLRSSDRISFENAMTAIKAIHVRLLACPAWMEYRIVSL